ncbi:MAG: hypothetical protein D6736_13095 [Nitrospinota bacterium]|nr:MAG: hypothetical protein D6736_13095 [Nitrospinota bacterium]
MRKGLLGSWILGVLLLLSLATETAAVEILARGRIRIKWGVTNFSEFSNFGNTQTELDIPAQDDDTLFLVRQRFRNWWTFKANEHLRAVWGMEIGYLDLGVAENTEGADLPGNRVGRGSGGGTGADGVNVETKNLYLQFDVPYTHLEALMGLIPFGADPLTDGAFTGDDIPGVWVRGPLGPVDIHFVWSPLQRHPFSQRGFPENRQSRAKNAYFFSFGYTIPDGIIPWVKGLRVGSGFNYIDDNTTRGEGFTTEAYMTGLNVAGQIGRFRFKNHFAYAWEQSGAASKRAASDDFGLRSSGLAPDPEPARRHGIFNKFELRFPLGPGHFKFVNLFVSGDSDRSRGDLKERPTQDLSALPREFAFTTDNFFPGTEIVFGNLVDELILVETIPNDDLGLIFNMFGYTLKPTPTTSVGLVVAPTWSAAGNPNSKDGSKYMGTEISLPLEIKLWDQLSVRLTPAYFITGGFFELDPTIPGANQAARAAREDPSDVWLIAGRFQFVY